MALSVCLGNWAQAERRRHHYPIVLFFDILQLNPDRGCAGFMRDPGCVMGKARTGMMRIACMRRALWREFDPPSL